jgi:glycosyltransferase involved in cell wall biosynthesis
MKTSNEIQADILAVVPYFVPHIGGGETHLYQLALLLSAKGHSVSILTQRPPETSEYEETHGITIQRFGSTLSQAGKRVAYARILTYIKQHEFQKTVLYEYLSVGKEYQTEIMCEILAVAREKGIPRVVRIPSSNRVTELSTLHPDGIAELRRTDRVIALNPGIYKELISFGIHPSRIESIPNGVNVSLFKPSFQSRHSVRQAVGCPQETLVFLCPSRFVPKKRLPDLVQLWKQIADIRGATNSCELWIVGDDHSKEVSRQVHGLARELKLTNLRIFPAEPHSDMPKYFQSADVYISLSTQEGMSNAMLEAMATGLPVIAPACDAVTPLIKDGWNGFLFIPGDLTSALAAIFQYINTAPKQREEMGKCNRQLICSRYRIEQVAERFSCLFNKMVFG